MINRRDAITLGAVAGAAVALPTEKLVDALLGRSWAVEGFTRPLPIPPVLRPSAVRADHDHYRLSVAESTAEILPGVSTAVLTYNGQFPGPTIRARQGRPVRVTVTNRMSTPTAVHLHGGNVPAESDGHPNDVIAPGRSRTYHYPNFQRAATLWYHDHAHHLEAQQVYSGLSGLYVIDEPRRWLRLPEGEFDVPLMFRDIALTDDGQLRWELFGQPNRTTVLVNGAAQPHLRVRRRHYRLRLVNCSNERPFTFRLSNGALFTQIASDGGLLPRPLRRTEIVLTPAERADVLVDFGEFPAGARVLLENTLGEVDSARQVLRFDVVGDRERDNTMIPPALYPAPPARKPTVIRKVELRFDEGAGVFLINGKPFDAERVDFTVRRGSTELWEITNADTEYQIPHSLHLHLIQFRVLDRDGVPVPEWETYPKDTVLVPPGSTTRILATFDSPFTGLFPFHCHFVDHSSVSMMAQLRIVS